MAEANGHTGEPTGDDAGHAGTAGGEHGYGHGGAHGGGHGHGKKAIIAALFANLGIAIAKFVGFLITRSSALLAETVHSLADTGNQGLLLLGGARAKREASVKHPFGYGRERFFWSFVVALVLFSLGALFAIYEGVQKLRHPHHLDSPLVAVGILAVAIVLETYSFRTAIVEARAIKGDQRWVAFIRHAKNPELPVVLLEDLGALAGLVIALAGVGLVEITDNADFDAFSTLTIGALLGVIAVILAIEMKSLLMGESASAVDTDLITAALERSPRVRRLIHLRTMHIGPEELLVAAKLELDDTLSFREVTDAIDETEALVRAAVPIARIIYLEPDTFDAAPAPGASGSSPG